MLDITRLRCRKMLKLNNWISCWRKAVQGTEMMLLHRGVGFRMILDKDKAPGGSTGPEIPSPELCFGNCSNQTVNSGCALCW